MLHSLITVIGTGSSRDAAVEEVVRAGGTPTEDGSKVIWAVADDLPGLEALSRRCPDVTFGVDAFEEFGDDLTRLVIVDGGTTELSRSPLLDGTLFGPGGDGHGVHFELPDLRRAGRMVLYRQPAAPLRGGGSLSVGMTLAASLGRFAERTHGWEDGPPTVEAVQAVADLGNAAAALCIGADHASPAECEHHRAMVLTRAVLHAGRMEADDEDASWGEWLSDLLGTSAQVLMATYECGRCEDDACRCHEAVGLSAIPLLTSCLQALATFQPLSAPVR